RGHRGRRPWPPGYRPGTRPDPGTRPAPGADGRPAAEAVPPCCLGPGTDPGDGDRVRPDGVAHEPGHRGPGRSGLRTRRPPPLRQCRTEPRPARGPAAAVVVGTLPAPDVVVAGGRAAPAGIVRTRRRPPRTAHAVTRWARGTAGLGHHRFSRRRPAGAAPATQPDARR